MNKMFIAVAVFVVALWLGFNQRPQVQVVDTKEYSHHEMNGVDVQPIEVDGSDIPRSMLNVSWALESQSPCDASLALKDWFDTVLTTQGEWSQFQLANYVSQHLHSQCSLETRSQAWDLWQRYLEYQSQLSLFDGHDLNGFRLTYFSPTEIENWFGEEDQYDQYMREKLAIVDRNDLTQEQKQAAVNSLENELPEPIKATRERAQRYGDLGEQVSQLREAGATEDAIFQLRQEKLGVQAAHNLAELDKTRSQWKYRLAQLQTFENSLKRSGVSQHSRQQQLTVYLNENFEPLEQTRALAILGLNDIQ